MKRFLKGAAAVAIVMVPLMGIHIILNMKGIDFNQYVPSIVEVLLGASIGTWVYNALIKNEKNKD